MSSILDDIVDEAEISPTKAKKHIKWGISIAITIIGFAFIFGEFKANFLNKLDNIESSTKVNTTNISEIKGDVRNINTRIDLYNTRIDNLFYEKINKR